MGDNFAQVREWSHERALDWALRGSPKHASIEAWLRRVAHLYRADPGAAPSSTTIRRASSGWWSTTTSANLAVYMRLPSRGPALLVAIDFTPVTSAPAPHRPARGGALDARRSQRRAGLRWRGGDGLACELRRPEPIPAHDRPFSLQVTLPPLGCLLFRGPEAIELRALARAHRAARIARETAIAAEELAREATAAAAMAVRAREAAEEAAQVARSTAALLAEQGDGEA